MKRVLALLLAVTLMMGLCACGGEETEEYVCPAAFADMEELVYAAREEGRLTVRVGSGSTYISALCQRFDELFGVSVTCEIGEQPKRGDDVWLGSVSSCGTLAEAGELAQYEAVNAADLMNEAYRDGENRWYVVGVDTVCIMVNTDVLKKMEISAPDGWEGLSDRVYRELIWMPDYGTTELGAAVALNAAREMGHDAALAYLTELDSNVAFYTADEGEAGQCLTSGECVIGLGWLSDGLTARLADGGDAVRLLVPDGALCRQRAGAVLAEASHPNAARLWQEFLLTAECADLAAENGWRYLPTVKGAAMLSAAGVTLTPSELTEWTETLAEEAEAYASELLAYMQEAGIDIGDVARFAVE